MTSFSVATTLLAACTSLGKGQGNGSAADKHLCSILLFPGIFLAREHTGTAPKSSLGVIAAALHLSALPQPFTPHSRILSTPCDGCSKAHPEDTTWDLEKTQGKWCVVGVLGEVVQTRWIQP